VTIITSSHYILFLCNFMALRKRLICPAVANEPTTDDVFIFNVVILYAVGFMYNKWMNELARWHTEGVYGSVVRRTNEVTVHWARLVLGWVHRVHRVPIPALTWLNVQWLRSCDERHYRYAIKQPVIVLHVALMWICQRHDVGLSVCLQCWWIAITQRNKKDGNGTWQDRLVSWLYLHVEADPDRSIPWSRIFGGKTSGGRIWNLLV